MPRISISLAVLGFSAALLPAQVGPGISRGGTGGAVSPIFNGTNANFLKIGNQVWQISMYRLANDAAGTWTACLTVGSLTSAYGGTGTGSGVMMGKYDMVKGVFTPLTHANALNTTQREFGLMLEPKIGRYAVFDRATGPFLSKRTVFGKPFGNATAITNVVGGGTWIDPALGTVGGKLKLFYVGTVGTTQGIYMDDFDVANSKCLGKPVMVAAPLAAGRVIHSPTPITGPDGDVEGFWLAERASNDSDMYFADDLDPKTPHMKVFDSTYWLNNGGLAGGRFFFADAANPYYQAAKEGDGAWLLGDVEILGGTANIVSGAFNTGMPVPVVTPLLWSLKLGTTPFQVPGMIGMFGLDLGTLFTFGALAHPDNGQRGTAAFPIPNITALKGTLYIQGLAVQPVKKIMTFTNTAKLVIK